MTDPKPSLLHRLTRGGPRPVWLRYLLLIAAASGMVRIALNTDWMRTSAVLYVLIPYIVGLLIYFFTPHPHGHSYGIRLWRHMRAALIIMIATSLLLFEGFLCVLMFLPIYFVFALVGVALTPPSEAQIRREEAKRQKGISDVFRVSAVPLLVILISLDGIGGIGPSRDVVVSRSAVLDLTPAQIQANIIDHRYPDEGRTRWLSLFPRPTHVEAKSIAVGARHTAHLEYRRWGVPLINVHRGTSVMEFTESAPTALRARFVHDDSYLSHYMRFDSWAMDLQPLENGQTEVTITVGYHRKLAPSWYFGPPMKAAVRDGLDYALTEIVTGEEFVTGGGDRL